MTRIFRPMLRLFLAIVLLVSLVSVVPQAAVALDWTARNGPEGGYVTHIAVDFTDPNIAYLVNYAGGIFKTTNGGTSWTDLHANFGSSQIFLDPTNHTTVYLVGGNIVKSTDAGSNWTILDTKLPCGDSARTLVLDPQNSSILYAIIVTKIGNSSDYYVIKSTNGGTSWNQLSWNQLSWKPYALAIDPTNSSILYASTTAGLIKTTDGGVTWKPSGTGLDTGNLGTVVIDPKTTSTLYVVADGVVYKSTNSGGQWQISSNGWESSSGLKAEYPIIDPLSPNKLYVIVKGEGTLSNAPRTIYKTIDGGGQWNPIYFSSPIEDVQVVALAPSDPVNLYAGTLKHGVFKSVNSGTGWVSKNSGLKALIEYMALDPTDKNIIYAGIPDLGVFRSSDGGNNWVSVNAGLGSVSVAALAISPVGSHTLWVSVNNAVTPSTGGSLPGIYKSDDGGATWAVTIIPPDNFLHSAPTKIVADPVNPNAIYALGIAGVYRTTDGGTTWFTSRNGVPDNAVLNSLAIDPKNPMVLYLGLYGSTTGTSLYKSTDGGIMWYPSSTGLPSLLGIYDLAIDPKTSSTLYAAVTTNGTGTVNGGVFKSIDSGGSWQDTTSEIKPLITGYTLTQYDNIHYAGAIPNCPSQFLITAFNLAIDSNTPATLFAVVDGLVLRTTDAAGTWAIAHSGLPFSPYQIGISPADHTAAYVANQGIWVYTGTGGGGEGGGTNSISVTSPNGGEIWLVGSTHDITWTSAGTVGNVKIELSTDGGTSYSTIVASTANSGGSGSYSWTVPDSPSNTVKIRISNDDGSISDTSTGNFTISTSGGGGGGGGVSSDLFVPVVLSSNGVSGSLFTTELTFTNRGTLTANVDLSYTATAGGGSGTASITIPPGQSVFSNAIDYLKTHGLSIPDGGSRVGTLRTHFSNLSAESDASITARLTTEVRDSSGALIGHAGLAYSAISVSNGGAAAISEGKDRSGNLLNRAGLAETGIPYSAALTTTSYICGLRQNATDRSNLAFQNAGAPGDGSITLQATVFDGESSFSQVLPLIVLEPGAFNQISGVLASNGLSLTNGYVRVERIAGTAPYYAYGVINDQVNSDGSFVSPQLGEATPVAGLTLPVIVQTGAFISELDLTNFSSQARTVSFAFVADAITTADKTAHFSINIPAGRQQIIPDIFAYMRNNGVAGIGPSGTTIAGALFATATGGDISGVVLGARTSASGDSAGGRFGLFYTAVPYDQASTTSAWVLGLQQNAEDRTNLAIVNTGETDASDDTFVIDLYDGATGNLIKSMGPIILNSRGWIQIGTILNSAPNVQQGYAHVRRTAGNNPFITYAVINDGAGPGQRTGDGAYIGSSQ